MTGAAPSSSSLGSCPSASELNEFAALDSKPGIVAGISALRAHVERCPQCREWVKNARFEQEFSAAVNTREFARDPLEILLPELPGYEIVREVSRGGQGIVYEAIQVRTRRRVALKILRQDHGIRRAQRARFEREIEIAAALHHPGIVAVYDSIALPAGRHALVLEFVEGKPLDQLFGLGAGAGSSTGDHEPPGIRRSVELLGQVCEAIHYAHQRGVMHRDLKPSNILVDVIGNPRILDFGVACWFGASATEPVPITITGEFAGTLAYAAPEQVSGARGAPDLRSDLYAIGVMLYQSCIGDLPYDVRGSLDTVIKNIAGALPVRPIRGKIDEDLWIIISKALSKEPDRRYQSGDAMASDLRRYLRGETIEARRDSRLYVVRKAISRHRYSAAGACAALAGLAVFGATLKSNNVQLVEALRNSTIERARALGAAGTRGEADELLWPELLRFPDALKHPEKVIFAGTREERRALWAGVEMQATQPCMGIAALPDARVCDIWWKDEHFYVLSNDGIVRSYSTPDMAIVSERQLMPGPILSAKVDAGADRGVIRTNDSVLCVEMQSGKVLGSMALDPSPGFQMSISPGGGKVAWWRASDGAVVCELPSFKEVFRQKDGTAFHRPWLNGAEDRVGVITEDGRVQMYELVGGKRVYDRQVVPPELVRNDPHAPNDPWNLSVAKSGDLVAIGRRRRVSVAYEGESAAPPPLLATVGNLVDAIFSASGDWMLSGSNQDSKVRVWRTSDWKECAALPSHTGGSAAMSVSPDDKYIVTVDKPGVIRLWSGPELEWKVPLPDSIVAPHDFAYDASRQELWAACTDGSLVQWSLSQWKLLHRMPDDPKTLYSISYAPKQDVLASAGERGRIRVLRDGLDIAPELNVHQGARVTNIRFSPDGRSLAASAVNSPLVIYDTETWKQVATMQLDLGRIATIRWRNDGKQIAIAGANGTCEVLSFPECKSVARLKMNGACRAAVFSGDGSLLATGGDEGLVRLWKTETWKAAGEVPIGKDNIFCLTFHPDGHVLAVGDRSGRVTQVGIPEGSPLASFLAGSPVMALEFIDTKLVVGTIDRPIELWDFGMLARCVRSDAPFWAKKFAKAPAAR